MDLLKLKNKDGDIVSIKLYDEKDQELVHSITKWLTVKDRITGDIKYHPLDILTTISPEGWQKNSLRLKIDEIVYCGLIKEGEEY